jgi:CubicO group peptidase (beta-lactamase class C family)
MSRIVLFLGAVIIVALLAMKPLFNVSPAALPAAVDTATGLGVKLACSGHFVSGMDAAQVEEDLKILSPLFGLVTISYDSAKPGTRSSLGFAGQSATYREGLGCTLDLAGAGELNDIAVDSLATDDSPWPLGERVDTIAEDSQGALEALLGRDTANGEQTRALVIAHRGAIVAEAYAGNFDTNTPILGWSMGKSVTAILVGQLEYQDKLDISDRQLFAAWQDDQRGEITLEQLLQMSSGLEFSEEYTPGSDSTRMLAAASSAAGVALEKPLLFNPGEHFSYSSGTTNLLARLVHDSLGEKTQATVDLIYQQLFSPLGMRHFLMELDPSGVPVGSSYVYGSARDWARLGQLMLAGGQLNGQRLLSKDWVTRASTPNTSQNEPRYGYQFWLNDGGSELRWPSLPRDAYAMLGHRGQVVMIIPSQEVVVVRLGWSPGRYPTNDNLAELLPQLTRAD